MKNTTIATASGSGKNLRRWRSGLMALFALLCVTAGFAQGTIPIGSGTANNASLMPINSCFGYNYSQQIVKATEYAAGGGVAGQITKIRFFYSSGGTTFANWNSWTVYLGHTSKTAFSSNTDWEPAANLTQVFTGTVVPVANGWMELTLSTPFVYNGTSNIVVAVDENSPSWSCTAFFGSYTGTDNTGIYYYNDSTNPNPASPPTAGGRTNTLARLQFVGILASCLTPTAITGVAASPFTANLSWTASASAPANGYEYYYTTSATAPTATTTPSGTTAAGVTTASISGLTSNTTYNVYVRSVCSATDVSLWNAAPAFTTLPTCIVPTAVTGAVVTTTTGTVTWTPPAAAPALGYEYYYATTNTAPTAATPASGSVAAGITTASLSGLTPSTTYYVWVRGVCTVTDKSSWAGSGNFYTGYCVPAPSSQDGTGITNFTLGTINNTTVSETGYYGNYSAQTASVALGSTANFSVTYATGFTYGTKIWVDWNNDLDFTDAGEQVYFGLSGATNPTTLSGSFVIPVTASLGNHRLRIGGTDNDTGGDPCYTGSWGSYEDYTLNLFMPPAPVITGFTPASYCAATGVITITGTSLGNATLTIGGTAVTPLTTNTTTQIVATVPAGVSGVVSVTTVAGTATTTATFNVSAPAAFTLSDTAEPICMGGITPVVTITTGASAFNTYVWSPSTGVSGSAAAGWTFSPTATTEYVLTASQSAGPCVVNATFNVTVNPVPNAVTIAPAASTVCGGTVVPLSVTTPTTPGTYCTPAYTLYDGTDYISSVSVNGWTNATGATAVPCYANNTGTAVTTLNAGSTYTVSVSVSNASEYVGAYIDFNQDGDFTDSGEQIATTLGGSTGTISFTVPVGAASGTTRLRVVCRWNSAASPCNTTGYGETEDYTINIASTTYTWLPATGLYTDAAGTIPYVAGTAAQAVYAMPSATATYTATATNAYGCTATGTATVTVNVTPAPAAVSPQAFTVMTYPANLAATGTNIQWYTTATGGTPLTATTEVWTGTYYASQTLNGCESPTRTAVSVSVILPEMDWVNLQWPPVLTVPQGSTGNVFAQGLEAGVTPGAGPGIGVQAWIGVSASNTNPSTWTTWIPMTYNTQVGNNDEFVAAIGAGLAPGTYYYASRFRLIEGPYKYGGYNAAVGSFWDGTANVSGVLTVTCATPAPAAASAQAFCNAAAVADLAATGTTVQWYAAATGGTALSNNTALVNGTTYYASQTVGCESLTRTAVTVTVTTTPAPTGNAAQQFTVQGWVSGLAANGMAIQWYAAATGGTPLAGTTALTNGGVYYASQTVNGCESPVRFAVTVSLVAYTLDFVNLQWPAQISVVQGTAATVYAQVYEANVTPGAGPGAGVTVMVGISTENTDPSTWTTWTPMTFNTQVGSNDEYMAMIGANLTPGTYYYAVSGMLNDGPYTYGGYSAAGGGTWNGTTNISGVLTVTCFTAAPWVLEEQQVFCNSATVADLSATGSGVQWYAAATGGTALGADAALADGTVYYASQTVDGCESAGRVAVTAYISTVAAPTGDAVQAVYYEYGETATIDGIAVTSDGTVTWYATEADALAGVNPIEPGSTIEAGTYYAITTVGACTSTTAFAVTVEVLLGGDHFDMAAFSYYPNPVSNVLTVTYSQEITSVTVFNLIGQEVINITPNANEVKVDMTALAEGTYILNVATGNAVKTIKVVKKQ